MKRRAPLAAILYSLGTLCLAANAPHIAPETTFFGTIHDNRCVGPNCAKQCPIKKGPTYTLQTNDAAWVLNDQHTPAQFNGKRVVVTGRVMAGNKLQVTSISPAR